MKVEMNPNQIVEVFGALIEFSKAPVSELHEIAARLGGVANFEACEIHVEFDETYEMAAGDVGERAEDYLLHVVFPTCSKFECQISGFALNLNKKDI